MQSSTTARRRRPSLSTRVLLFPTNRHPFGSADYWEAAFLETHNVSYLPALTRAKGSLRADDLRVAAALARWCIELVTRAVDAGARFGWGMLKLGKLEAVAEALLNASRHQRGVVLQPELADVELPAPAQTPSNDLRPTA